MSEAGFVETAGARIYYETAGAGEPLLFIHAGVANLRMWDDQVRAFAERYRVIRYDTRGFGRTHSEHVEFSNRADIAAVLDHLGEPAAHVVGLSRGGNIALDFALEYPERVLSVVVAAGGLGGYESPEVDAPVWEEPERLQAAKDWHALADWETRYWADGPGQPAARIDPDVRARVHDWILTNYVAEKEEGIAQPLTPPAIERLAALRAPLLVMIGTLDDRATNDSCRRLAELVPGARLEVFEGSAHMINLEQPEKFNVLLRTFLEQVPTRV